MAELFFRLDEGRTLVNGKQFAHIVECVIPAPHQVHGIKSTVNPCLPAGRKTLEAVPGFGKLSMGEFFLIFTKGLNTIRC